MDFSQKRDDFPKFSNAKSGSVERIKQGGGGKTLTTVRWMEDIVMKINRLINTGKFTEATHHLALG